MSARLLDLLLLFGGAILVALACLCVVLLVTGDVRRRARAAAHVRETEEAIAAYPGGTLSELALYLRRHAERRAREELGCGCAAMEYGVPCAICHGSCICHGGTVLIPGIWQPEAPGQCKSCGLPGDCRRVSEGFARRMGCVRSGAGQRRRADGAARGAA